jgi:hypothetical protein
VKTQRRLNSTAGGDLPSTPEANTERNNLRKTTEPEHTEAGQFNGKPIVKSVDEAVNSPSERVDKIVKEILALNIMEAAQLCTFVPFSSGILI